VSFPFLINFCCLFDHHGRRGREEIGAACFFVFCFAHFLCRQQLVCNPVFVFVLSFISSSPYQCQETPAMLNNRERIIVEQSTNFILLRSGTWKAPVKVFCISIAGPSALNFIQKTLPKPWNITSLINKHIHSPNNPA
jgi:hypothetical protein